MKKKILVMVALLCIMSMLVAFAGCAGKGNGNSLGGETESGWQSDNVGSGNISSGNEGGSTSDVNEVEQFGQIMTAVLNEFSGRLKTNNVLLSNLATEIVSGENVGFEKSPALQEIYDYMDTVEDKEIFEDNLMNEIAVRNFIAVRAYGELINKLCDTDKIYGVPIELDMGKNTSPSTAYSIILSEGTHIVVYLYGKDDTVGEMVYKFDVDYVSDSEFSAKMIMLNMPQLNSDETENVYSYYFYGDTDGRTLYSVYGGNDNGGNGLCYKESDSNVCYRSVNRDAIKQCLSKVKSEYDEIDVELIRALKGSCKCSATYQQYSEIADKLCEQYGVE